MSFTTDDENSALAVAVTALAGRTPMASSSTSTATGPIVITNQITVKLTEENYLFWRAQVLPILRSNGLMGYISKDFPPPSMEIANPQAGEAGAPARIPNPAYLAWYKQDQAILSAILTSLMPEVYGIVVLANTSEEAWTTLEGSFASQSTARIMQLRYQLSITKKLDSSAATFFNRIKALSDTLTSIGQPLRPEEFTSYLLAGLDADYDPFVDRVSASSTPLPVRDVYAQLLNIEQRIETRKAELRGEGLHVANYGARSNGGGRPYRDQGRSGYFNKPTAPSPSALPMPNFSRDDGPRDHQDRPRPVCQLCGKVGHLASRCYKRFKKEFLGIGNDGGRNTERQAAVAVHGGGQGNQGDHHGTPGGHGGGGGQNGRTPSYTIDPGWYADSGATDHLTSELDKLSMRERYGGKDKVHTASGSGSGNEGSSS